MKEVKKERSKVVGAEESGVVLVDDAVSLPYFELEALQPEYPGVLDDYMELFIQYGYVTLFAVAFPLSSLCAWLNNIFEVKMDGFKILMASQRPKYMGAEDIGTWQVVLEFVSYLAVASNCALICFTSGVFKGDPADRTTSDYINCAQNCNNRWAANVTADITTAFNATDWLTVEAADQTLASLSDCFDICACDTTIQTCYQLYTRIWIFLISEHVLLIAKVLLAWLIPDKPAWVEEAEARADIEDELEKYANQDEVSADSETNRQWDQSVDAVEVYDNEGQK